MNIELVELKKEFYKDVEEYAIDITREPTQMFATFEFRGFLKMLSKMELFTKKNKITIYCSNEDMAFVDVDLCQIINFYDFNKNMFNDLVEPLSKGVKIIRTPFVRFCLACGKNLSKEHPSRRYCDNIKCKRFQKMFSMRLFRLKKKLKENKYICSGEKELDRDILSALLIVGQRVENIKFIRCTKKLFIPKN